MSHKKILMSLLFGLAIGGVGYAGQRGSGGDTILTQTFEGASMAQVVMQALEIIPLIADGHQDGFSVLYRDHRDGWLNALEYIKSNPAAISISDAALFDAERNVEVAALATSNPNHITVSVPYLSRSVYSPRKAFALVIHETGHWLKISDHGLLDQFANALFDIYFSEYPKNPTAYKSAYSENGMNSAFALMIGYQNGFKMSQNAEVLVTYEHARRFTARSVLTGQTISRFGVAGVGLVDRFDVSSSGRYVTAHYGNERLVRVYRTDTGGVIKTINMPQVFYDYNFLETRWNDSEDIIMVSMNIDSTVQNASSNDSLTCVAPTNSGSNSDWKCRQLRPGYFEFLSNGEILVANWLEVGAWNPSTDMYRMLSRYESIKSIEGDGASAEPLAYLRGRRAFVTKRSNSEANYVMRLDENNQISFDALVTEHGAFEFNQEYQSPADHRVVVGSGRQRNERDAYPIAFYSLDGTGNPGRVEVGRIKSWSRLLAVTANADYFAVPIQNDSEIQVWSTHLKAPVRVMETGATGKLRGLWFSSKGDLVTIDNNWMLRVRPDLTK